MNFEDIWSLWLKSRRFGGDDAYQTKVLEHLKKLAKNIVDKAGIFEDATVLDIGTGDGLLGLVALENLGNNGKLILSDISDAALAIPINIFNQLGKTDSRVHFLTARAENLFNIGSNSIDIVLMRAVLLYINEKQNVFNEIYRVLKPNGRAVISEPINQRSMEYYKDSFRGFKLDREPLLKVKHYLERIAIEQAKENPKTLGDFNEHDLVTFSLNAGFEEIHLEYNLTRTAEARFQSWEAFFDVAPNPHASTLKELLHRVLNPTEVEEVVNALHQVVQQTAVFVNPQANLMLRKT